MGGKADAKTLDGTGAIQCFFWSCVQKKQQGKKVSSKFLARSAHGLEIENWKEADVETELQTAKKALMKAVKEATPNRFAYLETVAEARTKANGTDPQVELAAWKRWEKQRWTVRVLTIPAP